ncbi:hypothetical protein [Streptacidiphilus sp. PAMC 29251]
MALRLVRREARGDLPLLACLALLVAVLTALCALGPALVGRQEDQALRQRITSAQAQAPLLTVSTVPEVENATGPPALSMATVLADGPKLTDRLSGAAAQSLSVTGSGAGGGSYDYEAAALDSPRPPDLTVTDSNLTISHIPDTSAHLRYISGHAPADLTPVGTPPQVALSQATAQALGVRTGSQLKLRFKNPAEMEEPAPNVTLVVSGVFQLLATADGFWVSRATLAQPLRYPEQNTAGTVLAARGLVGTDAADLLTYAGVQGPLVTWQLRADLGRATVARARTLTGPLSGYSVDLNAALCHGADEITGGPSCQLGSQETGPFLVSDGLTPLLTAFTAEDDQARIVGAFAVTSLAAVALATAVVAVRLLLRRRDRELRLQRARGASALRLILLRSAIAWPVVLVSAVLGWVLGQSLAPSGTSGSPQPVPAATAAVVAALLVPLLTWFAVRESRSSAGSRRAGRSAGRRAVGGRRAVLELTVLLAAVAGVVALRSQGADGELSAVPVLVAVAAVLVLLRVYPLVLRLLARQTRRGSGLLAFVGLSRAARDASATGLALFVLVLTLGTAVFGGLVQRTVGDGAAVGAAWSTGADASATTEGNSTPTLGALAGAATGGQAGAQAGAAAGAQPGAANGIRAAVEQAHVLNLVGEADGAGISSVAVITVDPHQLTAVAPSSPLARALLSELSTAPKDLGSSTYQLPFVASPTLRARERSGGFTASFQAYGQPAVHLKLDPSGTLTPADLRDPLLGPITAHITPGTPLLITTASAEHLLPQQSSGSTVVLLHDTGPTAPATATATATATALRTAGAQVLGPLAQIRVRSEALAALRQDGLTRGVGTIYAESTALAVLFGLLAVALELVLTSAERGRTTSFLRTLGLGSRAAGALHLLQLVPLAVAAAVGGTLLGLLEPRLMGDSLNLRQFTGGPIQPALRTDYRLTLALGAGLALLVLGAAVVETAVARGRRLGAVLRLGQS